MLDAARDKIYLAIIAVLLLVVAAMTYKFILGRTAEKSVDERMPIVVAPGDRVLLLREMRGFVAGLRTISAALARDDMPGVAQAARAMGTAAGQGAPATTLEKLPIEFKTLALSVHSEFDAIASGAESGATGRQTLARLSGALQKCAACHNTYQVRGAAGK